MPDERTNLITRAPMGLPTTARRRLSPPDLRHAALCIALTFLSYALQYNAYFSPGRHSHWFLIGAQVCIEQVGSFWWRICRSFDAAVHKVFQVVLASPEQSADADAAVSANRKGTSVPDYVQTLLGLVGQTIAISMGLEKAGWSRGPAIGGGMVVTILTSVSQELTNGDVVDEVTRHRRAKEKIGSDEKDLFLYGESSQKLKDRDSNRRTIVLILLGLLIELVSPSEAHDFTRVLPFVVHTDEKMGKMVKARAEVINAWPFLKARFSAVDETFQKKTHSSASRIRQKVVILRQRLSGAATSVAILGRMWRVGFEHKLASSEIHFEEVRTRQNDAMV